MNIQIFYTLKDAKEAQKKLVGWDSKIIKQQFDWIIQCNGNKYLRLDGFVN